MNLKSVYLLEHEKMLIEKASKITGLSYSSFLRSCALKEARNILKENLLEASSQ